MSVTTSGVNHFAVSVRSLEESIEWYQRVLGFKLICINELDKINVKVAHMEGPGMVLELFEAQNASQIPEYRRYPNTDLKVHGNKHFALSIEDREQTKHELQELGVGTIMIADVWDTYGIFIRDPTGNLIELFEGDMRDHASGKKQ